MPETPSAVAGGLETVQERVLAIVRELAAELGGGRAARAATLNASLERDVGLGSLERVELILRLESGFGRALDDRFLQLDTPAELASLLLEAGPEGPRRQEERAPAPAVSTSPADAPTVHGVLRRRAEADPDHPHVYMREDSGAEETITYSRLWHESSLLAGGLRDRGIGKGDTVAFMLPTGADFLRSFQAALIAGAIPVPIYPPVRLDRLEEYAARQSAILADAGVRILVTVPRALGVAGLLKRGVPTLSHVVTADELKGSAPHSGAAGSGADPAFIQYTSGSTGAPKGVLLTHDNILANIRGITSALRARPTDVGVSWLPLYHDMGLIGSWLFCMHAGIPIAILSPLAFLARPERWLWSIHRRRATLSPAPNFAFELCVRRIPDAALEGLDLSSWRCALNGAEPVSPETMERFARRFERYGFRREAMMPVYGLAENSVALCLPPPGRGPRVTRVAREPFQRQGRAELADDASALRFVSVGAPIAGHEVRIVDEAGAEVPERTVGRLVFRGPSMTPGYFRQPEATAAITLSGGWLDSGDLAFLADGEVHIAGRRKDLIIKAGRNLVPQEVEEVASSVEGIRKGCVVAFGFPRQELGTESLVVVAETRAEGREARDALAAAVTDRVAAAVGLPPDAVVLVPPGSVPKTSSGKIRRSAAKELYLRGKLEGSTRAPLLPRLRVMGILIWEEVRPRLLLVPRALYALYLAAALLLLAPPFWLAVAAMPGRRAARAVERWAARMALRLSGCRLSVEGLDNLRGEDPVVLAANHASYADTVALLALLPRDFVFVAKAEILKWPFMSTLVRRAGHVTVERWEFQQGVADAGKIAGELESGRSVLMFPEGTFTRTSGLRPFRLGAFKTAAETGRRVVPLALRGTRRVLADGMWLPRPGRIHLWIGPPVAPEGQGWREMVRLRDRVADEIAARCGEPRLDLVAGGPVRD